MAPHYRRALAVFSLALILCLDCFGQTRLTAREDSALRVLILRIAAAEVGVEERTGHNDNPRIVEYHRSVSPWLAKAHPRAPYCASYVNWVFKSAGVQVKGVRNPALARDWFRDQNRIVLRQMQLRGNRRMIKKPKPASVVGYQFSGRGISHIEILKEIDIEEEWADCYAANTSARGAAVSVSRDGQGVYLVRRKLRMVYLIADVL